MPQGSNRHSDDHGASPRSTRSGIHSLGNVRMGCTSRSGPAGAEQPRRAPATTAVPPALRSISAARARRQPCSIASRVLSAKRAPPPPIRAACDGEVAGAGTQRGTITRGPGTMNPPQVPARRRRRRRSSRPCRCRRRSRRPLRWSRRRSGEPAIDAEQSRDPGKRCGRHAAAAVDATNSTSRTPDATARRFAAHRAASPATVAASTRLDGSVGEQARAASRRRSSRHAPRHAAAPARPGHESPT